ncbi:MAG: hypothetical protein Q8912_15980, partial [Bacillota bacterium]|nr:hypothetical protein [Bacillota bacterium]
MYNPLLKIIATLLGIVLNIGVAIPGNTTTIQVPVPINQPSTNEKSTPTQVQNPSKSTQNSTKVQLPANKSDKRIIGTKRKIE